MSYWKNKVVVVTGGSEGLGKSISLAFAEEQAEVVLLARDESKMEQMIQQQVSQPWIHRLHSFSGDVTCQQSVENAVQAIIDRFKKVDVWVNNVGQSIRHDLLKGSVDDYRKLMEINFYSAIRCSLLILPHLEQTSGHLINIGSLASKTGWPWMSPYSASKHALAAFHHQLRLEGPANVHYFHVCPGPLKRPDSATRYQRAGQELGENAAQPGAGAKLKGIAPEWLAAKIVHGCRRRQAELVIPGKAKILFALAQFCPGWSDAILKRSRRASD